MLITLRSPEVVTPTLPPVAAGWLEVSRAPRVPTQQGFPWARRLPRCSCLKADLASGHGVAQFRLVVDEGHQSHVGLDEQGAFQDQHAVRLAWQRTFFLGFFDSLD